MSVRDALRRVLSSPTAGDLWQLRSEMLEAGLPAGARAWVVLDEYHRFLDQIATATTSREYSDLASKLDIGSLSGIVLDRLLEPKDARQLTLSLLSGVLSEGLMVLATRQHVKAWGEGLAAVYRGAAWFLYAELWRWAEEQKPDLPASDRRELLDRLFEPVHSREEPGFPKAVLLGYLFQLLLVTYLSTELAPQDTRIR